MGLGYTSSIRELEFSSGSMVVKGNMSGIDATIVALGSFIGLTIFGLILIYTTDHQLFHMSGVIFLSRAWIDSIPMGDLDGALIAQNTTPVFAWALFFFEVLVSSVAIMHVIKGGINKRKRG